MYYTRSHYTYTGVITQYTGVIQYYERYRAQLEYKLTLCGDFALGWPPGTRRGLGCYIYITLRRYLPTPHYWVMLDEYLGCGIPKLTDSEMAQQARDRYRESRPRSRAGVLFDLFSIIGQGIPRTMQTCGDAEVTSP